MTQNLEFKAGHLIVFSEGEYSDYGYRGSYVCLQNVSHEEITDLADSIKSEDDRYRRVDKFESECIKKGWLAIIEIREIHLGSYGDLDVS